MESNTHLKIAEKLCGTPVSIEEGKAVVSLTTTEDMVADERGLVHGGFIFGLADYAAMLAVNDPNVVLGSSECRFLKPVKLGDTAIAEAAIVESKGKKQIVDVTVSVNDVAVVSGTLTCFVLDKHVFDL